MRLLFRTAWAVLSFLFTSCFLPFWGHFGGGFLFTSFF